MRPALDRLLRRPAALELVCKLLLKHQTLNLQPTSTGRQITFDQRCLSHAHAHLVRCASPLSSNRQHWRRSTCDDTPNILLQRSPFQSRARDGDASSSSDTEATRFDDTFCARLFATRALSLDFVIRGLGILGVEAIGPVSLRELAVREDNAEGIKNRIQQLESVGISLGPSRFSQLIRRCVSKDDDDLLLSLVRSDQHPDTVQDLALQEKLLAHYLRARDWPEVERTVAILTANTRFPKVKFWNVFLRANLAAFDLKVAMHTMETMRLHGIMISKVSTRLLLSKVLTARRQGHAPVTQNAERDDLGQAISLLFTALQCGAKIPPLSWKELIIRLGMAGRFDEVERLMLWLTHYYGSESSRASQQRFSPHRSSVGTKASLDDSRKRMRSPPSTNQEDDALSVIFPPTLQQSIVFWGFCSAQEGARRVKGTDKPPWTRGIALLKALEARGVEVHNRTVLKAFKHIKDQIFGPRLPRLAMMRRIRSSNHLTPEVMDAEFRAAWDPTLPSNSPTNEVDFDP
ncbi:MAG: hypothetical protein M1825_001467 [Sarcosagium campestre]|nr:MAG: hypothetical protein M1825_001467 [Sarcosagium campestre]